MKKLNELMAVIAGFGGLKDQLAMTEFGNLFALVTTNDDAFIPAAYLDSFRVEEQSNGLVWVVAIAKCGRRKFTYRICVK